LVETRREKPINYLPTVLSVKYFMVFLQFFHLTRTDSSDSGRSYFWSTTVVFGFRQDPFLVNCSVTFVLKTFAYCSTCYVFYWYPTVFPLDGLVLWVRAGAISGQKLQCDICIDDIFAIVKFAYCSISYLFYGFPTVFPCDGLVLWVRTGAISDQQL
jgi:hypothetical protein